MLKLDLSKKPAWYDLGHGVRLFCAPVTTTIMNESRHGAEVEALRPKGEDGAPVQLDARSMRLISIAGARVIARAVVLEWEGVGDEAGEPLPVTPEGLDALLDLEPMFNAFQVYVLGKAMMLDLEKNG